MCYNMVMSLAKKDTKLYQSILTDGSAFLTRLSNYWQMNNYQADLSKAKSYIRYRKLVQNGKTEAAVLFCKLAGLKEGSLSEDAMTQLENCYDQSAVENLILTLRPELADSADTTNSQDSGIKISKDSSNARKAVLPERRQRPAAVSLTAACPSRRTQTRAIRRPRSGRR